MKALFIVLVICLIALPAWSLDELVSVDVDLTPSGTYVDIGGEVKTEWAQKLGLFIETEGQSSTDMDFRILAKTETGGASEYLMNDLRGATDLTLTSAMYTVNISSDLTASRLIIIDSSVVPVIQVQGKSTIAGATGGMAKVTSLKVSQTRK